jgi:hypothetical protein
MNSIDFICVGAQKSGTTTLHHILQQHPSIFLPDCKECHFFDTGDYHNGIHWYYQTYFAKATESHLNGEITPSYMVMPEVAGRLAETVDNNLKLLFLLRDPVDRAVSHFIDNPGETRSFRDAINQDLTEFERKGYLPATKDTNYPRGNYIVRGFYAQQIKRFLKYFSIQNMHFVQFSAFVNNTGKELEKILDFLELENIDLNTDVHKNASQPRRRSIFLRSLLYGAPSNFVDSLLNNNRIRQFALQTRKNILELYESFLPVPRDYSEIPNDVQERLREYYRESMDSLEAITGSSFEDWKKPSPSLSKQKRGYCHRDQGLGTLFE